MDKIKVLIIEDEPPIARNLQQVLTSRGYSVVGLAFDISAAYDKLAQQIADLVLLDINLNGHFSGLEIAEVIRDKYHVPFIFITSYADADTLARAKTYQPLGYIVKPFTEDEIYAAIEVGWYNYTQQHADVISPEKINSHLSEPLTQKEYEILLDLIKGKPYKEIATEHFISLNTVNSHVKKIYSKFQLHTRGGLTEFIRRL
jgi:DNA-binding NarL/FixJ family response regulator